MSTLATGLQQMCHNNLPIKLQDPTTTTTDNSRDALRQWILNQENAEVLFAMTVPGGTF